MHLGICWRRQFYVDTCLPFGLRSAPALFNHYAEALDWIMANNYGAQLLHYLDDFLLVGPPGKDTCQEAMSRMLTVCDQLGIPVASEKLEGPTTALTFLGIVLDTSAQQLRLPPDKLEERPVAAMEAYRGCCRCPIQSSPLFHFRDGRPLTSKSFRSTFLSLVEQCGYNPAQYNTHSLRIGAATAAARAGLSTETIQKIGRWQSSAYQTYTRHPLTHPSDTRTMAAQ